MRLSSLKPAQIVRQRSSLKVRAVLESLQSAKKMSVANGKTTYESVQDYYGKVLSTTKDLKTTACTSASRPPPPVLDAIAKVPEEIREKFYGCGAPLPLGVTGLRVLDLGCGSGRDCYVMSQLVGEKGTVTGIDMTREQLSVAERHAEAFTRGLGYSGSNLRFVEGHIEYLDKAGIADESVDIIISNCVINLSPDKARVIQEAYRVLAPGGEMYFSDVYCDRRLSDTVQKHEVLWGECIAGALYLEDFKRIARRAGFEDPRILSAAPIEVTDPELKAITGEAKFFSVTYRLFKLPSLLESICEDYGQVAIYKGTIQGSEAAYELDDHHKFIRNKPMLVCGNTAAMVGEAGVSWLAPHFTILGDRKEHFGAFDCGTGVPLPAVAAAAGGACGPGGCC